jgi:hypothetical protein
MALWSLIFGGVCAILAVGALVKSREIVEMVRHLSVGTAFAALGLLDLTGRMDAEWICVSQNAVIGIMAMWWSISELYSPPSPSFPRWTQWALLVIGVGLILSAVYVLCYYWR